MNEILNNEEKLIFSQDKIVINEDSVYSGNGYFIGLFNEFGRNYSQDPYFKISWRSTFPDRCTSRVKFSGKSYVIHGGVKILIPSKNLKDLNCIIRSPYDYNSLERLYADIKFPNDKKPKDIVTVWQAMLLVLIKKYPGEFGPVDKVAETFNILKTKYKPIDFTLVQYPDGKYPTNKLGS